MATEQPTVFLVDDDPAIRKSMPRALGKRGLNVETFESAQSFLDNYQADRSGCLVLDLRLPAMDGLELQQELAQRNMSIPIIFITGHGDIPHSVQALKAGAIDFLEKPFRQETLLQRIEEAFAEDQKLRAAKRQEDTMHSRFARLTDRERDVMRLLVSGPANPSSKEIARELSISHRTIDHHRARVMEKTGARSIAELVRMAHLAGLVSSESD